ncbi:MAG TPA: HAD-IB family phosphatase [Gemmatimonadaceae bacterium]|nr:HAD-IB family phosphatase [Gemmatimonadaceae bacterium]
MDGGLRVPNAVHPDPAYLTVVFDCDSTLSDLEGIDALAADHDMEVRALTDAAMRGDVALEEVYARRLEIVKPSAQRLEWLGRLYVGMVLPDARAVVRILREADVLVRVVSGGLLPAILHVTRDLGIPDWDVFAVDVTFDEKGEYAGFDRESPLARSGGKRDLIASWDDVPRPIMMVGDGTTDLETKPVVDRFVAFAGVVERTAVVDHADVVLRDKSLAPVLTLALGLERPLTRDARYVYERGHSMLARAVPPAD